MRMTAIRTLCIRVNNDVKIRGYFSKLNGPASKRVWETVPRRI